MCITVKIISLYAESNWQNAYLFCLIGYLNIIGLLILIIVKKGAILMRVNFKNGGRNSSDTTARSNI